MLQRDMIRTEHVGTANGKLPNRSPRRLQYHPAGCCNSRQPYNRWEDIGQKQDHDVTGELIIGILRGHVGKGYADVFRLSASIPPIWE